MQNQALLDKRTSRLFTNTESIGASYTEHWSWLSCLWISHDRFLEIPSWLRACPISTMLHFHHLSASYRSVWRVYKVSFEWLSPLALLARNYTLVQRSMGYEWSPVVWSTLLSPHITPPNQSYKICPRPDSTGRTSFLAGPGKGSLVEPLSML